MSIFFKKISLFFLGMSFLLKIQYVLVPNVLGGAFYSEYLDVSVYLFDVCFLVILFLIIYNEYIILSSIRELFHVKQNRVWILAPLVVLALSLISVNFSVNKTLSLRQLLFYFEAIILYYGIIIFFMFHVKHKNETVSRETWKLTKYFNLFLQGLYLLALFNAFVAICQFLFQRDMNLYLLGESHLQIGSQNIATISFFGDKLLRAYGLFPHPNVLAAFLLLTLTTIFVFKEHFVSRETKETRFMRLFHVKHLGILCIKVAFLLTFSKIALLLGITLYCIGVSRETKETRFMRLFHVKHLLLVVLVIGAILFFNQKSFNEREFSLVEYAKTNTVTFFGNGIGTSYFHQELFLKASANPWLMQPVHNGYLLVLGEIGLLGLIVYIYFFLGIFFSYSNKLFHVKQKYGSELLIFFIAVLTLGDHYFFTLPQGIFLFWIFVALGTTDQLVIDNK